MKLINKKVPDKKVDNKGTNKITEITQYLCKQSQYYKVILEKEKLSPVLSDKTIYE